MAEVFVIGKFLLGTALGGVVGIGGLIAAVEIAKIPPQEALVEEAAILGIEPEAAATATAPAVSSPAVPAMPVSGPATPEVAALAAPAVTAAPAAAQPKDADQNPIQPPAQIKDSASDAQAAQSAPNAPATKAPAPAVQAAAEAAAPPEPQPNPQPEQGSAAQPEAEVLELPPLTPEEEALLAKLAAQAMAGGAIEAAAEQPSPSLTEANTSPPALDAPAGQPLVPEVSGPEAAAISPVNEPIAVTGANAVPEASAPKVMPAEASAAPSSQAPLADQPQGQAPLNPTPSTATPSVSSSQASALISPLVQFAQPFTKTSDKPLFSVVLLDSGAADLDRQALADLPLSVAFALDPSLPRAADYAALYRASGREVIMLLPEAASLEDLANYAQILPQSVVVMAQGRRQFQADRVKTEAFVPAVADQGRGLLTWESQNNLADQMAKRIGLPSGMIFRPLDGEDESAAVIRRYLDRAAFKADSNGSVIVVGKTRDDTVKALLEWSIEGRSANVTLAPLSAVLTSGVALNR